MNTFTFNGKTYKVHNSQLYKRTASVHGSHVLELVRDPDPLLDNKARLHGYKPSKRDVNIHTYGSQGGKRAGNKPESRQHKPAK